MQAERTLFALVLFCAKTHYAGPEASPSLSDLSSMTDVSCVPGRGTGACWCLPAAAARRAARAARQGRARAALRQNARRRSDAQPRAARGPSARPRPRARPGRPRRARCGALWRLAPYARGTATLTIASQFDGGVPSAPAVSGVRLQGAA